jgi:predicted ATPase
MAIKKIKVSNFKSFKELDLELGNFNVVIGANASGKSNFVQIFRFIRDIANMGLDNAISLQGSEYLTNIGISPPKLLSLKIIAASGEFGLIIEEKSVIVSMNEADYEFVLKFKPAKSGFEIEKDFLSLGLSYARFAKTKNGKLKEGKVIGPGKLIIRNEKGTPKFELKRPESVKANEKSIFPPFILQQKLKPKTLLLESPFLFFPPFKNVFSNIAIYDFDPKLSKKAVPVTGKFELDEDGSNLSLVLKSIVENADKRRKFSNLIKDLLPFVDHLATDKFADKFLLFKLRETYFKNIYFPASFISDGTVNISALYFEQKSLSIIEEPERNIHPHLISKVMDMMKDASENKQIIVTTHSPEVVKHTDLENILLVSRDKEGFSTISRPGEKKEVKIFLKNEMGVDELYIQNLLGE